MGDGELRDGEGRGGEKREGEVVVRYLAAGGVVVHEGRVLVLVRDSRGEVRLPKGHVEPGEGVAEAALRETREESGYRDLELGVDLGVQVVEFHHRERHVVRNERYFLMTLAGDSDAPSDGEEQFEPAWLPWDEALAALTFEPEREWVRRAKRWMDMDHDFEQSRWTLDALLPAHEGTELEQILEEVERQVAEFEASRERLSPGMSCEEFLAVMRLSEAISVNLARLGGYAHMWFSEDTQSQAALGFLGRMEQLSTDVQNRMLFFSLWWKGLDEEPAQRLIAGSGDYAYYLESLRRFKPYTLSEAEERIINLKDVNGPSALVKLYQMITNRFSFRLEVDGAPKEMTRDELSSYVRAPSPETRAAAYQELFRVYSDQGMVLAQIYAHLVRDWASENVTLRGIGSPIGVRNLGNDLPDAVVETLLDVCRKNMPVFHRYFRLKARWLGVERLRRYDIYAPVRATEKTYSFPEAVGIVLDSLNRFAPELAGHAHRVFADGHIDSEIRPGKRGGAFCAGILPGVTPWVLVNYVGKTDDVFALAHEIGHAVHALMAGHHSAFTFHSALPLAETASVFSEMLLNDRLLRDESDPAVRRDLLARILDGAYATVARQAYFVLFEVEAHRQAAGGATADELCELYMDNLREQFGDSVELTDDFRWEWIAIPHIYQSPFYCYAYSFGQLLVLALYRQYREEGASFVDRYLRILSHGGSQSPESIISEAGFDMASPDFWQGGFEVLRGMLEELEGGGERREGGERSEGRE